MLSESAATMSPPETRPRKQERRIRGLDIAKRVLHAVGRDERGKIVSRQRGSRPARSPLLAPLPPGLIGLAACGGAPDWARRCRAYGHEVKRRAPPCVKPDGTSHQHDSREAEALAAA